MRPRTGKALLLASSLLLSLAVLELTIRFLHLAPDVIWLEKDGFRWSDNPRIAYEPVPYAYGRNSWGFRDRERAVAKSPGRYRIIVLGDSITEGTPRVRAQMVFTTILEKELDRVGANAEVVNFGVSGYNTQQEVALYRERGRALRADLILLAYCLNDRELVSWELANLLAELKSGGGLPLYRNTYLNTSHTYRLLLHRLRSATSDAQVRELKEREEGLIESSVPESFRELATLSAEDGQKTVVVVFPQFGDDGQLLANKDDYPFVSEHEAVRSLADSNHFFFVDLLPAFQECGRLSSRPLAFDRYHPTEVGHQCAGRQLARYVKRTFLD